MYFAVVLDFIDQLHQRVYVRIDNLRFLDAGMNYNDMAPAKVDWKNRLTFISHLIPFIMYNPAASLTGGKKRRLIAMKIEVSHSPIERG